MGQRSWLCIGLLILGGTFVEPVFADDLYEARTRYRQAVFAFETGRASDFRNARNALQNYPLHPYLVYYDARSRLSRLGPSEAATLRNSLEPSHLAGRFFRAWLKTQAKRERWSRYLEHYQPTTNTEARCYYLRALYKSGSRAEALAEVEDLWTVAKSQPQACDPLFETWIAQGGVTEAVAWRRLGLAVKANEVTLARYLLKFFEGKPSASAASAFYNAQARPAVVKDPSVFPDTMRGREALAHGLVRFARREPDEASELWRRYQNRFDFADEDIRQIDGRIDLAHARNGAMPANAPNGHDPSIIQGIAEEAVRHQAWETASDWIAALPDEKLGEARWRYWLGRAKLANGDPAHGHRLLGDLARERTYYGFLAADTIGREGVLNSRGVASSSTARTQLRRHPAVQRMTELYAVGDLVNARREWRSVFPDMHPDQQATLIELATDMGWLHQAIIAANREPLNDLLHVRFPTPYKGVFQRHAFEANLAPSLLFAVSRQESAFNPRAISSAGARGLMQLMPGTARLTASRVRADRPSAGDLLDPMINVRLGAHHIAELMAKYDGHRALMAAAYNAGAGRVTRWTRDAAGTPTDVWIENIPFRETRNYVKNVLAFNYVYASLLGDRVPVLGAHERTIP